MIKGIYEHVWITPYPLIQISELSITKKLNRHDTAYIKGMITKESLSGYQESPDSDQTISLYFEYEGEKQLLFCGFLEQMTIWETGEYREVEMKLAGLTKALDRKRNLVDYQEAEKTMYSLINRIMKNYNNLFYEYGFENKEVESFLLQYEETDYEFLRRILSKHALPIYTVCIKNTARICFGRCNIGECVEIEETDYDMIFQKGICYRIERKEFWNIGERITAFGRKLFVKEAGYKMKNGISQNEYLLCGEDGFQMEKQYNEKLVGISLDGTIKKCTRDKVKIELNMTPEIGEAKERLFPYATVASSSDGSGWYCMPEEGEQIRLFCPTENEEAAYVVSAIRSGGDAADSRKPVNKELCNKEGQSVRFTGEGVTVMCAGQAAMMELKKDGTIIIEAKKDIDIHSLQNVCIRAEEGIVLSAADEISFVNETGSSFTMKKDIEINANRIKNNC